MKKEATAHALAVAAFQLTLEKGLDGFVVDDIVKRAGYSRRTFANHFSRKEEAVVMAALPFESMEEAMSLHAEIPSGATPLDMLHQWMKMQFTADLLRRLRELHLMSERYPTLEPHILSMYRRLLAAAHESLHDLFQDRYPIGYSHQLIGAVYGMILPIVDGSLPVKFPGDPPDDAIESPTFEQYLDTAFGYLRHGF